MNPAILALSTATPPYFYQQNKMADLYIEIFSIPLEKQEVIRKIFEHSAIKKRHSVVNDFNLPRENWVFWGKTYPDIIPGMSERNALYKQTAPALALQAAKLALTKWGELPEKITHIISISCTGVIAPGIEFLLMQQLNLSPSVNRLGINFMGCFGAFKGLSVARSLALENPNHRILVVCTELCTLHMQAEYSHDAAIANSLFADGGAAAIIGAQPTKNERPLWEIAHTSSIALPNSLDKMSWEASDKGYLMGLSPAVPVLVLRNIKEYIDQILMDKIDPLACDWAIHPGGKSIIQAVERAMKLTPKLSHSTWEIFSNYGNMSSATYLFVLNHLSNQPSLRDWCIGVGFGPGLSIEGMLLKRCKNGASEC